jgi:hypothetical protein
MQRSSVNALEFLLTRKYQQLAVLSAGKDFKESFGLVVGAKLFHIAGT